MPTGNPILLDACVLINLVATGKLDAISGALHLQLLMTQRARVEVGGLRDEVDGAIELVPIELEHHITAGVLTVTALRSEELPAYVDLARELGDGEASTIAAALNRRLVLATDDRKARRVSIEHGLAEPIRTTDLIRRYCEQAALEAHAVRELLFAIQQRAHFVPPRSDSNQAWWVTYLDGAMPGSLRSVEVTAHRQ